MLNFVDPIFEPDRETDHRGSVVVREERAEYRPPAPFFLSEEQGVRLYQGDALLLMKRCKSEMFDLIFADPPYFLSNDGITCHAGKMVSVNKGKWDRAVNFEEVHRFNLDWLAECRRALKPNGTIFVSGTSHNIYSVGFAMQTLGYKILNDIAWFKVNPPPNLSCRYFTHATETILWAKKHEKARHLFHYEEMKALPDPAPGKQMLSLWRIPPPASREKRFGKHPTQKPEALLDRIIRAASNAGDVVFDPFCGSGTTGVACVRNGRRFVGIEQEDTYLRLAVARISAENKPLQAVFVFGASALKPSEEAGQTWAHVIVEALKQLGGEGRLQDINRLVQKHPRTRTNPTWTSTVRRTVRQTSSIEPLGQGRYRLKSQTV